MARLESWLGDNERSDDEELTFSKLSGYGDGDSGSGRGDGEGNGERFNVAVQPHDGTGHGPSYGEEGNGSGVGYSRRATKTLFFCCVDTCDLVACVINATVRAEYGL
jgi:hypothetical protein